MEPAETRPTRSFVQIEASPVLGSLGRITRYPEVMLIVCPSVDDRWLSGKYPGDTANRCSFRKRGFMTTIMRYQWVNFLFAERSRHKIRQFARCKPAFFTPFEENRRNDYNFAYSALAFLRTGMSWSASFQSLRKSR